jgi:signal peptidase
MAKTLLTIVFTLILAIYVALAILIAGLFLPRSVGYQVRLVETGSMVPTIPVGSAIFVKPEAAYKVGDIITFQHQGDALPTTHRIVSATTTAAGVVEYATRGDANNANDWQPVAKSDVLGRVWLSLPYLGYVLNFIRTPLGVVIIVVIPSIAVFYDEFQKTRRKSKEPGETTV